MPNPPLHRTCGRHTFCFAKAAPSFAAERQTRYACKFKPGLGLPFTCGNMTPIESTQSDNRTVSFLDIPEELFAEIGCRLVALQDFEGFLGFVAKVVFEGRAEKARASLLKGDKRTMGQLLGLLRKQSRIEKTFDAVLGRVLNDRNEFVHNLSSLFDLRTEAGQKAVVKFLWDSMDDLEEANAVLIAAIVSYGRATGLGDQMLEAEWRKYGDLSSIESKEIPRLDKLFKELTGGKCQSK